MATLATHSISSNLHILCIDYIHFFWFLISAYHVRHFHLSKTKRIELLYWLAGETQAKIMLYKLEVHTIYSICFYIWDIRFERITHQMTNKCELKRTELLETITIWIKTYRKKSYLCISIHFEFTNKERNTKFIHILHWERKKPTKWKTQENILTLLIDLQ